MLTRAATELLPTPPARTALGVGGLLGGSHARAIAYSWKWKGLDIARQHRRHGADKSFHAEFAEARRRLGVCRSETAVAPALRAGGAAEYTIRKPSGR